MFFLILNRENNNMPTIEELRQDLANKQTTLDSCSQALKELTTQRANQQRLVTRKENERDKLKLELARLETELDGDKEKLTKCENARANCSARETGLLFEVGGLKRELNKLETSEAVDCSVKSSHRGRFGAN